MAKPVVKPKKNRNKSKKLPIRPAPKPTEVAPVALPAGPTKLSPVWRLAYFSWKVLWDNRKVFIGISAVYGALSIILVTGISALDQRSIHDTRTSAGGGFSGGIAAFLVLLGSAGTSASPTAGIYQALLIVIASLALIWALRQVMAGNRNVRIRDAFYRGMYPLIPTMLILLVMVVQAIPLIVVLASISLAVSGVFSSVLAFTLFVIVALALVALSAYLLSGSVIGLYIVALPDMTPVKALRSARNLLRQRRWTVLRKLLFVPFAVIVIYLAALLPFLLTLIVVAPWIFMLLLIVTPAFVHAYIYTLYRELIR